MSEKREAWLDMRRGAGGGSSVVRAKRQKAVENCWERGRGKGAMSRNVRKSTKSAVEKKVSIGVNWTRTVGGKNWKR